MTKSRKRITLLLMAILLILSSVSVLLYVNSTFYKVKNLEKRWQIELPLPAKKQYAANETFIDGSVNYLVYTVFAEPDEAFFTKNNALIRNDDFTLWFSEALEGIKTRDGEAKVPAMYKPDFTSEYEYMFLSPLQGNRIAYFYGIFVASSLTMYLCTEVSVI